MTGGDRPLSTPRLLWLVFWISVSVLGFEIALMRLLLVASWHHFAFLVISIALLAFGASGTALTFARPWILRAPERALFLLALGTGASMPLCTVLAQHIPIESRFVPALLWRQLGYWTIYWGLLAVPFFFGAAAICATLMAARANVAAAYGSNLLGSALGAVVAPAAMTLVDPAWLPLIMAGAAWLAALPLAPARLRGIGWSVSAAVVAIWLWLDPPHVRVDPYKYAAHLQRLVDQGSAARVARSWGPRAVIEAYRSEMLHDLPFLGVGATPPPITAVVMDGHWAGSVLEVRDRDAAHVVDGTLMAVPYSLAPPRPRVALLGEIGGANVWLALRSGAATVDSVQPHARLIDLLRGPLRASGGAVLEQDGVRNVVAEPRHFVEHAPTPYDIIQLVVLEGSAAGSGGVGGLAQDDLVTVEGLAACLDRLSGPGIAFACRGIQDPPRDNVKLLSTFVEALRRRGVESPQRHVVVVRDYLAVCTMVKVSAWSAAEVARIRELCHQRQLTPVWYEGIRPDELNRPDALPGPPDGPGDWYHHAARALFSENADEFIRHWRFDIRPPTDDRPFFADFCRLGSIGALRKAYGELWLTRTELAFPFAVASTVVIAVIGALLILVPLRHLGRAERRAGRAVTAGYFAAIGLAYLLLEMTCLARLTHLIGDPVLAASVTITGFLCFSGAGSLVTHRCRPARARSIIAALLVAGAAALLIAERAGELVGSWPATGRAAAALIALAPAAFLMGFPMPMALRRLEGGAASLIPWAWGVNGFASVLATPLAMLIGMTWGFRPAAIAALGLYALAAVMFAALPDRPTT